MAATSQQSDDPWKDEDRLRELYWDGGLSQTDLADRFGVSQRTIQYWMDKFGIETRSPGEALRVPWASFYTRPDGYEQWMAMDYQTRKQQPVYVHRLLAVAEYGTDAVAGKVVHHDNEVPWDNRAENIVLMEQGEHAAHHWSRDNLPEWTDEMRERMSEWAKQRERIDGGGFQMTPLRRLDTEGIVEFDEDRGRVERGPEYWPVRWVQHAGGQITGGRP